MKKRSSAIADLLEKCRTMKEMKQLHGLMITTSVITSIIPLSRLIDFCANSEHGDLDYAKSVFDQINQPSIYIWNSMIKGFCNGDEPAHAIFMYREMQRRGFSPDNFTFPFVLKACAAVGRHNYGECVHNRILKTGYELECYSCTCLLNMYASCADMDSALKVFENIPKWNVVSWTTLIAGFVNNHQTCEAVRVFRDMEVWGVEPNEITLVNMFVACARSGDTDYGEQVYDCVRRLGYDPFSSCSDFNLILATAIVDFYAKCGRLKTARKLFNKMPQRNLVVWNSMMAAYNQHGRAAEALDIFFDMRISGFVPDNATFLGAIGACSQLGFLALGQSLHALVLKTNLSKDVAVGTALVDMHARIGDAGSAVKIFNNLEKKDVMAWTTMITSLAMHGNGKEALHMFQRMQKDADVTPDQITYTGVLCACSHLGLVEEGQRHFHSMINDYGIEPTIEHYGCMVDLLSRAGQFEEAERLVDSMPMQPNVKIWSSLLNGCETYENVGLANKVKGHLMQLQPNASGVYVLLSNIYAKAGRWQEVKMTRAAMNHRRIGKTLGQSSVEIKLLTSSDQ